VNSFAVVIPARLESTRLPGKVMKVIDGMTMVEQVVKRVSLVVPKEDIFIATDSHEVMEHSKDLGINSIFTSNAHQNGTSRVSEAATSLEYEYVIIVQADEILLVPDQLHSLIKEIETRSENHVFNVVARITEKDLTDVSVVKSILATNLQIVYLTRSTPLINLKKPYDKFLVKNTGIFAYPKETLMRIQGLPDTPIQQSESIEQLKLIEYVIPLKAVFSEFSYPSINEQKDLESYYSITKNDEKQKSLLRSIQ
jgi:3-deoxy-manno-octulosonate cytidylyltransferase (CMP-KDO synthetase)